jgi:hypothetical protein
MDRYCATGNIEALKSLDETEKKLLIEHAFRALHQKVGNQDRAKEILQHYGLIENVNGCIVYKGPGKFNDKVIELEQYGITSIPIYTLSELGDIQKEFAQTLQSFPEYRRDPQDPTRDSAGNDIVHVLGGFAALGNPASFHNPLVRKIRLRARHLVQKFFARLIDQKYYDKESTRLEMLFDRLMFRPSGMKPVAEAWHRDVMPQKHIHVNDEIYGGWVNLDSVNQYFSCIPGSHLGVCQYTLEPGFATIDKSCVKEINQYKIKYVVPPGHIVIFPQYILHEVVANPVDHDMHRLFIGWRTTNMKTSILGDNVLATVIANQGVPPLPGGMIPPVYSANHGTFYLKKRFKPNPARDQQVTLSEWSQNTFLPQLLHVNNRGDKIVKRHLSSLKEYGLQMYPEYTREEYAMYMPQFI